MKCILKRLSGVKPCTVKLKKQNFFLRRGVFKHYVNQSMKLNVLKMTNKANKQNTHRCDTEGQIYHFKDTKLIILPSKSIISLFFFAAIVRRLQYYFTVKLICSEE